MQWCDVVQAFTVAGYAGEMTAKKSCKYGEYWSFEHLLFLLKKLERHESRGEVKGFVDMSYCYR